MSEFVDQLRTAGLTAVNIFGVAVPGFLLVFIFGVGFVLPGSALTLDLSGVTWPTAVDAVGEHIWPIGIIVVVMSYIAGYILRLSTPDDLDQRSAQKIVARMKKSERLKWACQNPDGNYDYSENRDQEDKFPYLHLHEYLRARSHADLLQYVEWGADGTPVQNETTRKMRSKTHVNRMKALVMKSDPGLGAAVASNEAQGLMIQLLPAISIFIDQVDRSIN